MNAIPRPNARPSTLAAAALLLALGSIAPARAEVNIGISIGAPPPVIVQGPPRLIFLNEPAIYAVVGAPYDLYYDGGHYYYLHRGNWFKARKHDGPWAPVVFTALPRGLQVYRADRLRGFRDAPRTIVVKDHPGNGRGHGREHGRHK